LSFTICPIKSRIGKRRSELPRKELSRCKKEGQVRLLGLLGRILIAVRDGSGGP